MRPKHWTAGAVLVGLASVAVACGGDDSSASSDGNLIDRNVESAVKSGASSTTVAPEREPTTMEGWEALWKSQRDAIVTRIKQNHWGLQPDGRTVLGPDGFTVDLTRCPAGWSETEGLSDTEIKLGAAAPSSGTSATGVYINQAASVMTDHYADEGMITDSLGKERRVNQIIKDDGYDPARTIPIVDELIDSEKVFEVQTQGSPSSSSCSRATSSTSPARRSHAPGTRPPRPATDRDSPRPCQTWPSWMTSSTPTSAPATGSPI